MKVVIAIDSFKGSMSSMEAGNAAKAGIERACAADIVVKPLADGGEGTTEALVEGLGGEYVSIQVTGPLGAKTEARYGILGDKRTAVLEMAEASGIILVKREELDPTRATTYGVGEMILDAVERGCREFIIGIGGSATSEGGTGMLQALGYEFLDEDGNPIRPGIRDLDRIASITAKNVPEELKDCHFRIACDVKNPLCGENGAVYVFGPQKGVKEEEKQIFDRKMKHFADKTQEFTGADYRMAEGAGAAGGLGFAFLSYIKSTPLSVYFNSCISLLLYRYGYNGILTFLRVRQSLYYARPNLDRYSALSTLILDLPHIHRRILCACILLWYQFLFRYLLCIWNKKKHPIL